MALLPFAAAPGISQTSADARYVLKAGDTMTGTLNGRTLIPTANLTYNIGSTTAYYSNLFGQTLHLNSTASIDGTSAGIVNLTGQITAFNSFTVGSGEVDGIVVQPASTDNGYAGSLYGAQFDARINGGASNASIANFAAGGKFSTTIGSPSAARVSDAIGGFFVVENKGSGALVDIAAAGQFRIFKTAGTITDARGMFVQSTSGAGTIGTLYGLYIDNQSGATTNYAMFTNRGDIRLMSSTSDKFGMWNATPVIQPTGTTELITGLVNMGARASGTAVPITTTGAVTTGNLTLGTAGNKISITTGTNASAGTGTLVGGTATISTTVVTANSLIFLTDTASSITNVGSLTVSAKTAGTSFVVTSTLALDISTFNWIVIN